MKPFTIFLLGIIVIGIVIYMVPSYRQEAIQLVSYSACDTPLPYRIGSIDPRFDLSQDAALSDIAKATNLWSSEERKNLFVYSPSAQLTVNFVYDRRQALNRQINQLNNQLDQNNQTLKQQVAQYEQDVAAFNQKVSAFESTVDRYNSEGGAPPDVYKDLVAQQKELKAEQESLNARARQLNLSTDNYNAGVSALDQDITQFNSALAKKPEEGLYNGFTNTITIYLINNQNELVHTLGHEFGHSLGMDHVPDPDAIMYPYTTTSLTVTDDDMKQLAYVCREQSAPVHWLQKFYLWLDNHLKGIRYFFTGIKY